MDQDFEGRARREPWNKGKLVGQKAPLRLKDIWAIRVRLQLAQRTREFGVSASAGQRLSRSLTGQELSFNRRPLFSR